MVEESDKPGDGGTPGDEDAGEKQRRVEETLRNQERAFNLALRAATPDQTDTRTVEFGAVAIIDALGFKGIWQRPGGTRKVVDALEIIRTEALRWAASGTFDCDVQARFLSDTIVLAAVFTDPVPARRGNWSQEIWSRAYEITWTVARAVAGAQFTAAICDPALTYRGCIAAGGVVIRGDFVIGEAVDEAAESMNEAEAGIVWFTPSAREVYDGGGPRRIAERMSCVPYTVPLKNGRSVETLAVNPLSEIGRGPGPMMSTNANVREQMMATFGDPSPVPLKKENTERFLDAVALWEDGVRLSEIRLYWHMWEHRDPADWPEGFAEAFTELPEVREELELPLDKQAPEIGRLRERLRIEREAKGSA